METVDSAPSPNCSRLGDGGSARADVAALRNWAGLRGREFVTAHLASPFVATGLRPGATELRPGRVFHPALGVDNFDTRA